MFNSLARISVQILVLAAAVALVVVLAGCGGNDDDYQPPAPSPCAAKPPATDGSPAAPGSGCKRG